MSEDNALPEIVQTESIKLIKNTKGYNWEIKVLPVQGIMKDADLLRLQELDNQMIQKFGGTTLT